MQDARSPSDDRHDERRGATVDPRGTVLVVDPLDAGTRADLEAFATLHYLPRPEASDLRRLVPHAEVLVCRSGIHVDAELLSRAPRLKLIVRAGTGTDNIDLEEASRRNVRVVTLPGYTSESVAELGVSLILALLRHIVPAHRSVVRGEFRKSQYTGNELRGKTVGLVGYGRVARALRHLLTPFQVELCTCRRSQDANGPAEDGVELVSFETLLERSDVLILCLPLTGETRGMLGFEAVRKLKRRPILVNLARWEIIDESALLAGLEEGLIAGVAIDPVPAGNFDGSRWDRSDVILLPHLGAQTEEGQRRLGQRVVACVREEAARTRME